MFWKKKVEKPVLLKEYIEKTVNGDTILGWLKMPQGTEFTNWLANLQYTLTVGILEKPTLTNEELQFRKGELNALKILRAKIIEIRSAKPNDEQTEE